MSDIATVTVRPDMTDVLAAFERLAEAFDGLALHARAAASELGRFELVHDDDEPAEPLNGREALHKLRNGAGG